MNWYHWHKEISSLADKLSDRFREISESPELTGEIWLATEAKSRKLIDEVCQQYAETKSWPINITPRQVALVYFRLVQAELRALELAQGQHILNQSPAELDLERADALKFLLVDYWHSAGRAKWLAT